MQSTPQPLVSVIVPAYKHEKFIEECLHSVLDQTYNNVELLVIDDGSPDTTWELIQNFEKKYGNRFARVSMQSQMNEGLCETYNRLLAKAEGKYVYILNSDDVAKLDAVEVLVEFLENNADYAVAVGDNDLVDHEGRQIWWNRQRQSLYQEQGGAFATFKAFFGTMPKGKSIDFLSPDFGTYDTLIKRGNHIPNGYLIRKSTFEKIGGYVNDAPVEDYFLFLQVSKFARIAYIDKILLSYRWHGDNTICKRDEKYRFKDRTLCYEKGIVDSLPDVAIKKSYYEYINKKRIVLKIGSFFCFYKIKNFMHKKYIVDILGKEFLVFQQNREITT